MELKEVQSFSIAPAVAVPFAVSWSEENTISIITEKGIYIVEVFPAPDNQGFDLHRKWIKPNSYLPTAHTDIDCDNIVWKLNQKEVYQMALDTYLAPNLVSTKSVPPYVTQLAWSPSGMLHPSGCLLASVTNYGCVAVEIRGIKQWQTLVNISSLWVNKCASDWVSCDSLPIREQFDILQTRANKLKATCITWSPFIDDRKYCLLIVGMQDGTLLFWQLNVVKNILDNGFEPTLLLQYGTDQYHITSMHCTMKNNNSGILYVGDVRGIIKAYSLNWQGDEFTCTSLSDLWPHNDRIKVTKLCTVPSNNPQVTVVAVKGSFVIAIALDAEYSVITTKPYHVGNLSINGMVSVNNSSFMVVTHNGSFRYINILRAGSDLEIKTQPLNTITATKSAYYGISSSINKAIFCLVTGLNMMFDHLIQREPAQVIFFTLCGLADPYEVLLSNPTQTLTRHWDYLQLIRLQGPPFPDVEQGQMEQLSSYHLKIRMWLCRFAVMQEDPEENIEKQNSMKECLKRAEYLVLTRHISKYVKKLTSQKCLSNKDKQSLALILSWMKSMETELKSHEVNEILRSVVQIKDLPERELCAICQKECEAVENPTESKCVAGHVLPRCSISMLQCSEVPYWICDLCHSVANFNTDVAEPVFCIYCDSLLQIMTHFLASEEEEEEEEEKKDDDEQENEAMEVEGSENIDETKTNDEAERVKEGTNLLNKDRDTEKDDGTKIAAEGERDVNEHLVTAMKMEED